MNIGNEYVCYYCFKKGTATSFSSEEEIEKHMKEVHNVKKIKTYPAMLILNRKPVAG